MGYVKTQLSCTLLYYIMLYYIFPSTQLQVIEITATCFDFNQSSFRRVYEPLLVTICFCAFGIPDGLQFSYAYNAILIHYFRVLGSLFLYYFITLTTTCFGHCGPSPGHKNVNRGKLYIFVT